MIKNSRIHTITVMLLVFLTSCGWPRTIDFPLPVHSRSHITKNEERYLQAFNTNDPKSFAVVQRAIQQAEPTMDLSIHVDEQCRHYTKSGIERSKEIEQRALPGPIVAAAASPLVAFGAEQVRAIVNSWAASYETTWSARHSGEFYQFATSSQRPPIRHTCFAVWRQTREGENEIVHALFVGAWEPSSDGVALRLQPVLLIYNGTKARVGSGGRFNSSLSITLEAVWLDNRTEIVASRGSVFATSIDFGQLNLNSPLRATCYYADGTYAENYNDRPCTRRDGNSSFTWLPYVPLSQIVDRRSGTRRPSPYGSGPYTMTLTMAEAAGARDLAAAASKIVGQGLDDLVGSVQSAR